MKRKKWEKQPLFHERTKEEHIDYQPTKDVAGDYLDVLRYNMSEDYHWTALTEINLLITQEEWEEMGRTGYGNNHWQEYSLDDKYLYVYTHKLEPEFPEHIPYVMETRTKIGWFNKGCLYRFELAI